MDGLYLKMQAEYDQLIRAREEIARVRNEIEKLDANSSPRSVRSLEKDLARSTEKFDRLAAAVITSAVDLTDRLYEKGMGTEKRDTVPATDTLRVTPPGEAKGKESQTFSRVILENELQLQEQRLAVEKEGKEKRILLAEQEYKEKLAVIQKERDAYKQSVKESGGTEDPAILATYDNREAVAEKKRKTDIAAINNEPVDEYTQRIKALTTIFLSEEEKKVAAIKKRYDEERKWAREKHESGGMDDEKYKSYSLKIDEAETQETLQVFLDKYKGYVAARKKIEEQFDAEIQTLTNGRTEKNAAEVDAAIAEAQKKKKQALSHLDLENFQKEIDWTIVFGNLENVSTVTLNRLQTQLKNYLAGAGDSISKEDSKVLTDGLKQIGKAKVTRKPIEELASGYDSYQKACEKVALAQEKVNELEAQGDKSSSAYKKAVEDLTNAQDERHGSLVSMTKAMNAVGQQGGQMVQAGNAVVGMFSDLGVKMPAPVTQALGGIGQVFSSMASINLTNPLSVITSMTGMVAGLGKAIGSLFNKDHKKEKNIERLQKQIDVLHKSYKELGDSIEKAFSKDASGLINQQNELLEEQKLLLEQQIQEEEAKKKTDKNRIKGWKDQIDELDKTIAENKEKMKDAIFGEDLKSAINNFAEAYAQAWASGEDRAKASKDFVKNMIKQMIVEAMKADVSEPMKLVREKLLDFWSDNYISDSEQATIDRMIENMTNDLDRKYEWADKYLKGDEQPQQEEEISENSLRGAYAKASQESIDLLAGQTGAQRVAVEAIREQMRFVYELQAQGWQEVRAIRDLTIKIDKNSEQVADNTRLIHGVAGQIFESAQKAAASLDSLDSHGIKVKM